MFFSLNPMIDGQLLSLAGIIVAAAPIITAILIQRHKNRKNYTET